MESVRSAVPACPSAGLVGRWQGDSEHCIRDQHARSNAFETCSKAQGGGGAASALAQLLGAFFLTAIIGCLAGGAALILLRRRRWTFVASGPPAHSR